MHNAPYSRSVLGTALLSFSFQTIQTPNPDATNRDWLISGKESNKLAMDGTGTSRMSRYRLSKGHISIEGFAGYLIHLTQSIKWNFLPFFHTAKQVPNLFTFVRFTPFFAPLHVYPSFVFELRQSNRFLFSVKIPTLNYFD